MALSVRGRSSVRKLSDAELRQRVGDARRLLEEAREVGRSRPEERPALLKELEGATKEATAAKAELGRRQAAARKQREKFLRTAEAVLPQTSDDERLAAQAERLREEIKRHDGDEAALERLTSRLDEVLREQERRARQAQAKAEREADLERKRQAEREQRQAEEEAAGLTRKPPRSWKGADPAVLSVLASEVVAHFVRGSIPAGERYQDEHGRTHSAAEVQAYLADGGSLQLVTLEQLGVLVWATHLIAERDGDGETISFNPKERALRPRDCPALEQHLRRLAQVGLLRFEPVHATRWTLGLGQRAARQRDAFLRSYRKAE
jgi:hypothetical protein